MSIINGVEILESDAVSIALFTEMATWGYQTALRRNSYAMGYDSLLYMDMCLPNNEYLQFHNLSKIVVVYTRSGKQEFQLASPTLFADLKRFIESYASR